VPHPWNIKGACFDGGSAGIHPRENRHVAAHSACAATPAQVVAAAFSFASCVFFAGGWPTLVFDANNHISDGSVAHDAAGNIMQDAFNKYTYDSQNHMIASQSLSSGSLTCYFYDAYGRRVQKTDGATSCGYPITGGTSLYYVYDLDGNVIDEVSAPNGGTDNWTRQEIYAAGRHLATFSAATGQAYWDFADWLGTERARASAVSGAVVETCTSLPWGDNQVCTGTDQSPLHFTGKQRDTESGLDNFGARYNSSSMGRFTSPDPLLNSRRPGNPQTWNRYAYALNNPLSIIDPTGLYDLVNNCATDDKKCNKQFNQHAKDLKNGLANLQKQVDKMKDGPEKQRLEAPLMALGTQGDNNGVNVNFGALPPGVAGQTTLDMSSNSLQSIPLTSLSTPIKSTVQTTTLSVSLMKARTPRIF
jgi:RHS repeat-associated protein